MPADSRLCRLGVSSSGDITSYDVKSLRVGWYWDWRAVSQPSQPGGINYVQSIRFAPSGSSSYIVSPDPSSLAAIARAQPGATWLVGNEPDQKRQDNLEPRVYARAYHDVYCLFKGNCPPDFAKGIDPTARLVAGSIVQPTPLRLRYLQMVVDAYRELYGTAMPADAWAAHTYPLNEQSCNPGCPGYQNCWGAEIPPGMSDCEGEHFGSADAIDPGLFRTYIVNLRAWMAANGYRDRPLILPEWGVLMRSPYVTNDEVNNYMTSTMQYILNATDANTGYPADNNRLVQRAAWFSLNVITGGGAIWNGWLFDPNTKVRTVFGDNFAAQTGSIGAYVNLKPEGLSAVKTGSAYTLSARVVNNGNISTSRAVSVRFYDGPPGAGGRQIGTDQTLGLLDGCANSLASVSVAWTGGAPGKQFYVVVDPIAQISEEKADNQAVGTVP